MSRVVLKLEPRLDTAAAGNLANAILENAKCDLELDASQVTHLGALALQVLRAAARSWHQDDVALTMTGVSTDCADQINLLGFAPDNICRWDRD